MLDNMDVSSAGDVVTVIQALSKDTGPSSSELPGGGPRCIPPHPPRGVRDDTNVASSFMFVCLFVCLFACRPHLPCVACP